jgi:hypothetical protein
MSLIAPTVPPIYVPRQGSWNMQYGPLVCGASVIDPATLVGIPMSNIVLSVTGGGPIPMQLAFTGAPNNINLLQSPDTNIYNSAPYLYLGTAIDPITHIPYSLMGSWNITAISETQILGTLTVLGTNGCTGATVVQLQQY